MKSITPQFRDASDYIIGSVLLVISLMIILAGSQSAFNKLRITTLSIYSYLEQPLAGFKSYKTALDANNRLREQNILLQDELNRLRSAANENERLRKLLKFESEQQLQLEAVQVIGKELTGIHNFITIKFPKGTPIQKGMPLINEEGLIGQIVNHSSTYAQVMPFFSKLFRVSGLVYGKTPAYGIVSWEGDNYNELSMDYVPATIDIQKGDLIVTSGYSNIYPPNIPIGRVDRIERSPGIETQKIYLRPEASLFDLTAGFVLTKQPDSSRTAIIEAYKKQFQ